MLGNKALDHPPVYLSSSVFPFSELQTHKRTREIKRENIYVDQKEYQYLQSVTMTHAKSDTAYFLAFGPNTFRIKVISEGEQLLTLLQSAYKGWRVSVSGKEVNWFKSNYLFMSVLIPKGENEVVFRYENHWIKYGFIGAAIVFGIVLMTIFYHSIRNRKAGELIDQ